MEIQKPKPNYVQFEQRAVLNKQRSLEQGYTAFDDVDYALIYPAGSKDCVEKLAVEWLADMHHKAALGLYDPDWYKSYQYRYDEWKKGQEVPEEGTAILMWPVVSKGQVAQLLAARVRTVEDLATLPESGLQMIGMGAREMQAKAIAWLQEGMTKGVSAEKVARLEADLAQAQEVIKTMEQKIRALEADTPKRRKEAA